MAGNHSLWGCGQWVENLLLHLKAASKSTKCLVQRYVSLTAISPIIFYSSKNLEKWSFHHQFASFCWRQHRCVAWHCLLSHGFETCLTFPKGLDKGRYLTNLRKWNDTIKIKEHVSTAPPSSSFLNNTKYRVEF